MRLVLKEIATPLATKKKEYGWRTSKSRKNIVDTISNQLASYVSDYIIARDLDPKDPLILDLKEFKNSLSEISSKFDFNVDKLIVEFVISDLHYGENKLGSYDLETKTMIVKFPLGYGPESYQLQKQYASLKDDPTKEKQLNKLKKDLEKNPRTDSSIKKNVDGYLNNLVKVCTPNSPERRQRIKNALKSKKDGVATLTKRFSTWYHETRHTTQFNVRRLTQLNSYFSKASLQSYCLPQMPLYHYTSMESLKSGKQIDPLIKFFYLSKPVEIDAVITQIKLFYNNLRKVDRQTAIDKTFDHIIKELLDRVKDIKVDVNFRTDKLAEDELKTKCLYKFFLLMSLDDKQFFTKTPKFQEQLDQLKSKVEQINQTISTSQDILNKVSEQEINLYREYSTKNV